MNDVSRKKQIQARYRVLAYVLLPLTIIYYVWMIYNWINLDEKKALRSEQRRLAKAGATNLYPDKDWKSDPGAPLLPYGFYLTTPRGECNSVLRVKTSSDAAHIVKLVTPDGRRENLQRGTMN